MTRRTRGLALVLFALAVPACTALAGLTDDYRLADAGGTATEGGSGDGNVDKDGALSEGSTPGDGSADATNDQLVGDGGAFCATVPTQGLENGNGGPWIPNNDGDGGTSTVTPTGGANGSAGFQFTMNDPTGSSSKHLWMAKLLPGANDPTTYRHYELQFDFRVLSGTLPYGVLGTLSFTSTLDPEQEHGVAQINGNAFGTPPSVSTSVTDNNLPAHWHRAHLLFDRGAAVASPYIRVLTITDSAGMAMTIDNGSSHVIKAEGDTELRLGVFNTFGTGSLQVVFDNVFVRRY